MAVTIIIGLYVLAFILGLSFSSEFRGKLQSKNGWAYVLGLFALIVVTLVLANAVGINID